ncbi:MAG: polyprenol monophosphomannose synthase [Elusimicrobiota bacterium]|nr:polyprenol monophosphomannose synthase [Elusimicrobiota bacterium]
MKSIIIIPTYNEKENIERLIEEIKNLDRDFQVLIIDDNSPDGTGRIADALAQKHSEVSVIHRPGKLGLGTAYITGFKYALENNYDLIFTMDADFSHQTKYLIDLLEKTKEYDLVIGSRYIKDGGIQNWPLHRLILSRGANIYVRMVTRLPIFDSTGGFNCYRREILEKIDLDRIISDGYAFQIEIKYRLWEKGFSIKEVPITFIDRTRGTSKISKGIILQAFFLVWKLRLSSND